MKYSVIIPTHNNKILLKNTLEALNHQNGFGSDDYEVIVVDDGSTDNTAEYIDGVNRNYRLRYLYLERCPQSCRARTRNHGWKNASGEIIAFIDSDIIVKNNYLTELSRCFALSTDISVIGNRLMMDKPIQYDDVHSGSIFQEFIFDNNAFEKLEYRYFLYEVTSYNSNAILCPWTQVYSCNLAVPRKWLEHTGGFDENFIEWGMEDIELGYTLFKNKVQLVINSKLEVLHQYHGPRNDLIIKQEYIPGYNKNIEYFISKHPKALNLSKKNIFKFFSGEISDGALFMPSDIRYIGIDFKDSHQLANLKNLIITSLKTNTRDTILVINDYIENTDFDIWIQLPKDNISVARYYPMSKRLNQQRIKTYLKNEKDIQRKRDMQRGTI